MLNKVHLPEPRSRSRPAGSARHLARRFVREIDARDGVAWCAEVNGSVARLLYVDVPGVLEETRHVPVDNIRSVELSAGTRIWIPVKPFGWIPAEIVGPHGGGRYWVRVRGETKAHSLWSHEFCVRWNQPLSDPIAAVAHGIVTGWDFYAARQPLLRSVVRQRAAYKGFTGAASAAVIPFQHQLDVLSRVTVDPAMRFLLADEVGLGKTIEAGLIMRQLLLDDPQASIAVLVPETLIGQWRAELTDRLALGPHLSRVLVAPHEALAEVAPHKSELLVIDEAHRMIELAQRDRNSERLLTLAAQSAPGLLLLTATPMYAGASGFLRLLNLIDPNVYRLDDIESFRNRLQMRQEQARKMELLRPGVPRRMILEILQEFATEYDRDNQLLMLLNHATHGVTERSPDAAEQLRAVADHLRETYRISRRVIRHRRDAARTHGYPVSGRRPARLDLRDTTRALLDDFLDDWRSVLTRNPAASQASELFVDGVINVLAGPGPALEFMRKRIVGQVGLEVPVDPTERALLNNAATAVELRGTSARLDCVVSHVQSTRRTDRKVLVFTSFGGEISALAEAFRRADVRDGTVARHMSGMAADERDHEVNRFLYQSDCRVMLADGSAAEGRNFQMVDEVVFLDLPLSPNALEQRIGRVDRFNLRAQKNGTRCTYLFEEGSLWVQGLFHFLRDVTGVFDKSVATLQRPLDTLEGRVRRRLLSDGYEAFNIPVPEAERMMDDERNELDELSELEDTQFFTDFNDANFDDLLKFEDNHENIAEAFGKLTRPGGGIGVRSRDVTSSAGIIEFRLAESLGSVQGLNAEERAMFERVLPGRRTFDKLVAATMTRVQPVRIGDPLTDLLSDFLGKDDRGHSVATLMRTQQVPHIQIWFGFDYLIEFNDLAFTDVSAADRTRLRRQADALFSPRVETVWSDGASEAPPEIMALLPTIDADAGVPLRGRAWEQVLSQYPPADWARRCTAAAELSAQIVMSRRSIADDVADAVHRATAESRQRIGVMRARAALHPDHQERMRMMTDIDRQAKLAGEIDSGLRHPRSRLLACIAAVFLPVGG